MRKRLCPDQTIDETSGRTRVLKEEAEATEVWAWTSYPRCWYVIIFQVLPVPYYCFRSHTGIGTLPITLYGTEVQKQKFIPKLATGECFGAYCLTEPGAGSDANSGRTKAVLFGGDSHYKITGQKMISNAGFADLIVFARIEDDKNITGFIVPKDLENGITLGDEEHKLGIHSFYASGSLMKPRFQKTCWQGVVKVLKLP